MNSATKARITRVAKSATALGMRNPWLSRQAFNLVSLLTPTAEAEVGDLRFIFDTGDRVIGRHLFQHHKWEEGVLREALESAEKLGGQSAVKDRVFVDVGANIGTASLSALRLGAKRALAVEAHPEVARYLRANVALNGLEKQVVVAETAATDMVGTALFRSGRSNSGAGELVVGQESADAFQVKTAPLDEIIAEAKIDVDEVGLVWVDAQAHEASVLRGASEVIRRGTPFVIEFWPDGLRSAGELENLIEFVRGHFDTVRNLGTSRGLPAHELNTHAEFDRLVANLGHGETDLLLWPAVKVPSSAE